MKKNIFILLAVLILALLVVGCSPAENQEDSINEEVSQGDPSLNEETTAENNDLPLQVGKLAPDFIVKDEDGEEVFLTNLDGEEVSLEDYRGKIVFLNFWATWCEYCDMEMPDLQKIDSENDDLVVIGVNVMEDKETVEKYIEAGGYEFEVILDEDGKLAQTYLVNGFPTTHIISKEGNFLGGVPGMMEYDQMLYILEDVREKHN